MGQAFSNNKFRLRRFSSKRSNKSKSTANSRRDYANSRGNTNPIKRSLISLLSNPTTDNNTTGNLRRNSTSSTSNFKWLEGRPYLNVEGSQFIYPSDAQEADRLNSGHFCARTAALTNYFAPIKSILSRPGAKVLDVGCGTGIWVVEMAKEFPNVGFIGLDITEEYSVNTIFPKNCTFIQFNALEGLPFADATFDYVNQRGMVTTWTKQQWKYITEEMMRVLKPGGYIELWEMDCEPLRQGPASRIFNDAIAFALQARGLDPFVARRLQGILAAQGIRKVQANFFSLPFAWGGPIGQLNEHIHESALMSLKPWLINSMNVSSATFDKMMTESNKNMQEYKSYINYHQAWGMKSRMKRSPSEGKESYDGYSGEESERSW